MGTWNIKVGIIKTCCFRRAFVILSGSKTGMNKIPSFFFANSHDCQCYMCSCISFCNSHDAQCGDISLSNSHDSQCSMCLAVIFPYVIPMTPKALCVVAIFLSVIPMTPNAMCVVIFPSVIPVTPNILYVVSFPFVNPTTPNATCVVVIFPSRQEDFCNILTQRSSYA